MHLTDTKGYVFGIIVNDEPGTPVGDGEVCVAAMLASPRTAFFVPPRAVDRFEVLALILHLEALLDGLVEVYAPESEDGWVEFPSLYLSVRGIYAPDGHVAFEVSARDCGCDDEREFNHGSFITIYIEPETLEQELMALDASLRVPA